MSCCYSNWWGDLTSRIKAIFNEQAVQGFFGDSIDIIIIFRTRRNWADNGDVSLERFADYAQSLLQLRGG